LERVFLRRLAGAVLLSGCLSLASGQSEYFDPQSGCYKATVSELAPFSKDSTEAIAARDLAFPPPTATSIVPIGLPGDSFPGPSQNGLTPADANIAVGLRAIVATVNGRISIHEKQDGTIDFEASPNAFFSDLPISYTQIFDPRCWYDRDLKRFWIMYCAVDHTAATGYLLLALSDDENPIGTWYKWALKTHFNNTESTNYWCDYPGMGGNKDVLAFGMNMFPFGVGSPYGKIRVCDKTQFLALSPTITWTDFWGFSNPSGGTAMSLQPARQIGGTGRPIFANAQSAGHLNVFTVEDPLGIATLHEYALDIPPYWISLGARQPENAARLDTLDGRVLDVSARNDRLLVCNNIKNGDGCALAWYEVDLSTLPDAASLVQQGLIGDSEHDHCYGSLQRNGLGTIATASTRSGPMEGPALTATGHQPNDPAGVMGTVIVLRQADSPYLGPGDTSVRWGDYLGGDVDPCDDFTFWGIGMLPHPTDPSIWVTEICAYTIGEPVSTLNGALQLQFAVDPDGLTGTAEFRAPGSKIPDCSFNIALDGQGSFELSSAPVGVWDIAIKVRGYLRAIVPGYRVVAGKNRLELALPAGDLDGSNIVDTPDLNLICLYYLTSSPEADVNGDGYVDMYDLNPVLVNFLLSGSE
jgi:hypothetical protein